MLLAPIASDGDGDPESLEELDGWYRPFLVESIMKSRPDLLAAHLICLPIDELELLFGGLIMVANGFPTKYVEQIEYRIEHPQVYAFEPLADVAEADAPEDDSPRPPPAAAAAADVVVEAAPPPPAADDDDDDDDQVDHLKKRLLRDGQSTYVDKLSGFSFDMASYAVGPDDEGAEPLESKLKRDIILALRAMDWLPAGFKKVIKYLREHGWTKDEAPDAVFNAAATQLFEAGKVQLSFRRDGSPFEVW